MTSFFDWHDAFVCNDIIHHTAALAMGVEPGKLVVKVCSIMISVIVDALYQILSSGLKSYCGFFSAMMPEPSNSKILLDL